MTDTESAEDSELPTQGNSSDGCICFRRGLSWVGGKSSDHFVRVH